MSRKPLIEVDEEMLIDTMLQVPGTGNRQRSEPAAPRGEALPEKPAPAQTIPAERAEADPEPARSVPVPHGESKEPEPVRRGPYRKKKLLEEELSYRDQFLVNDGICSRVSTYINRDAHEKIKRLLSSAAPNISIVSYINNIVVHHLEQYQEEITELYRSGMDKPF